MNKTYEIIVSIFLSTIISSSNAVIGTTSNTTIEFPSITSILKMETKSEVTISEEAIKESILNKKDLEIPNIVNSCMYTTHQDGLFDLLVTTTDNFKNGIDFALFNQALGTKMRVFLAILSEKRPDNMYIQQGVLRPLPEHSSDTPSTSLCSNPISFKLLVPYKDLTKAKPGKYSFEMFLATSNYSGDNA